MPNRVFVYGTLKANNHYRGLNQFSGAEFVGEAQTTECQYKMISLGAFPGVIPGGYQNVRGEVWEVDEHTLTLLDQIEGYPNFYNRKIVATTQGDAWMYYLTNESLYAIGSLDEILGSTYDDIRLEEDVLEWLS